MYKAYYFYFLNTLDFIIVSTSDYDLDKSTEWSEWQPLQEFDRNLYKTLDLHHQGNQC